MLTEKEKILRNAISVLNNEWHKRISGDITHEEFISMVVQELGYMQCCKTECRSCCKLYNSCTGQSLDECTGMLSYILNEKE